MSQNNVTVLSSSQLADLLANPYRVSRVPIGYFFVELDGDTFVSLQMKKVPGDAADTIGPVGAGDVDVPAGLIPFGGVDGLTSSGLLSYDPETKRASLPQTFMYDLGTGLPVAAGFVTRNASGPIEPALTVTNAWLVQGADDEAPYPLAFASARVQAINGEPVAELAFGVANGVEANPVLALTPDPAVGNCKVGLRIIPGPPGGYARLKPLHQGANASLRLHGQGTGSVSLWNAANTQLYLTVSDAGLGLNGHPGGPIPPPVDAIERFAANNFSDPPTPLEIANALNVIVDAVNALTAGLRGNGTIGTTPP